MVVAVNLGAAELRVELLPEETLIRLSCSHAEFDGSFSDIKYVMLPFKSNTSFKLNPHVYIRTNKSLGCMFNLRD